ncbi:hypothetical protein D3C86_1389140 [compost metagenome]
MFIVLIAIALALMVTVEIITLVHKRTVISSAGNTKKDDHKTTLQKGYLYLFLIASILSLITIWAYIVNGTIMSSGPPFLVFWLYGIPLCLILFAVTAHSTRLILKRVPLTESQLQAFVIVAIGTILFSLYEIMIAYLNGRLFLH